MLSDVEGNIRGTEKQITWASAIKKRVTAILAERIEVQKKVDPGNIANLRGFTAMPEAVSSFNGYAGEMISLFGDVRRTGDIPKDLLDVLLSVRASRITTYSSGELGKALRAPLGLN